LIFSPQIFVIVILIVLANSKSPKADGIALPKIAGYNDHITKKERRSRKCTTAPTAVPGTSPTTIWLLYQISSLLKTLKLAFCIILLSIERLKNKDIFLASSTATKK
jgi:hypothetical protein